MDSIVSIFIERAEKAFLESQKSFEKWIKYHLKSDLVESPFIIPALIWNMSCQKLTGNGDACL